MPAGRGQRPLGHSRPHPPDPPPDVHIQPGGAARLSPVLLVKPEHTFEEPFPRDLLELLPRVIFTDGFESGDTSAWSNTVP